MGRDGHRQRLEEAVQLAEAGQKSEAEAQLRALVAEGARIPKAAMALGVLCGERGDLVERRLWLEEARRMEVAIAEPPLLRLRLNLLVDALEQGEAERAVAYGEEALALEPEDGEVHLFLARALRALGQEEKAFHHLNKACRVLKARLVDKPEDAKAWRLLATAEHQAGQIDSAIEAHQGALVIDPNHLPTLLSATQLLMNRGQVDRAMPWLMNALAIAPDDPDVLTIGGTCLKSIGEINEAVSLYRQALAADPKHQAAALLLGDCLCKLGLFMEAEKVFREALERNPKNLDLKSGLGAALRSRGDEAGALEIYREVYHEAPECQGAFNNLMFTYSVSSLVSPLELLETANQFWVRRGVHRQQKLSCQRFDSADPQPLRVGLLSADIGEHVVGWFLDPLLRHHDPGECQLELISMKRRYEGSSEALIAMADAFHSLEGLPTRQAQDLLKCQNYDLIIDTSGYTNGSGLHLLSERCAPVQAHYIGYHATTGLPTIDWFIGDEETAALELQEQFSERLWRLPRPWLAYSRIASFPEAQSLVDMEQPVLGCFCQLGKISGTTLEFWGEILRQVPDAVLVLKDRGLNDPGSRDILANKLKEKGINLGRIHFLGPVSDWKEHCEFYNIIDIALDTTPWSSATTGFEALGMGVPLVAIRGKRMSSRMSSSLVKSLGHPEWACESPREAAQIVKRLCGSIPTLRKGKKELQITVSESLLSDGKNLSETLIKAFWDMHLSHLNKLI